MVRKNSLEMYSTHNEGKSVVAKIFIRTLQNRIYKYMTLISKNVYIDKLDAVVKKCNNTYHSSIEQKSVDVKSSRYIDSSKEINDEDPKFKIGDTVRILKYKNIFAKGYVPNWFEDIFMTKKVNKTVTNVINDLKGEQIVGTFYEKELQKTNQKKFRV